MFCKPGVMNQLWRVRVPHHTTLYSFSFWSSSYTLMATVCRISPSQFVGFFSTGLRSGKECVPLPYYAEGQLGLSFGNLRGDERLSPSLEADLQYFKRAGTLARFGGPRRPGWGFAGPGNFVGTCHIDPSLLAQN